MEYTLNAIYLTKDDKGWEKKTVIPQLLNIMVKNLHKKEVSQLSNEYRPGPKRLSIRSFHLSISSWIQTSLHSFCDIPRTASWKN